jgi:hypothetical protein
MPFHSPFVVGTSARHAAMNVKIIVSIETWLTNLTDAIQFVHVANAHSSVETAAPQALMFRHVQYALIG